MPPTWPAATAPRPPPSWPWPTAGPTCSSRSSPASPTFSRGAVGRATRDGRVGLRRPRPAHPGHLPRRPGRGRRGAAGWPPSSARNSAGTTPASGSRPSAYAARVRARPRPGRSRPRWTPHGLTARRRGAAAPTTAPRWTVTRPTPVTPVDAGPDGVVDRLEGRAGGRGRRPLPAAGRRVRLGLHPRRRPGRGRSGLVAGGHRLGGGRRGPVAARRWWPGPPTPPRCRPYSPCCDEARVPVTPAGGRSGVCGASVPLFGGVALDLCGLAGIAEVDDTSLVADLRAGTFGPDVEAGLRDGHGLTLGHWPQSMDLSTVGGWLACRGAGQYSNRYGKIEDMVLGLEVVLADGRIVRTGGRGPRSATGPDLTQLFVGSEGTLGVITEGRFRVHPVPEGEGRRAFGFASFADGLDACRRILRRGASPAVLRLYDAAESGRNFDQGGHQRADRPGRGRPVAGGRHPRRGRPGVRRAPPPWTPPWSTAGSTHRNDVSALAPLWRAGIVVDTVEVSGRWAALPGLYDAVVDALDAVPGTLAASSHQSHAYTDGACLYFTFAGRPPDGRGRGPGRSGRLDRRLLPHGVGRGHRRPPWPPAVPSATTTASDSTGPASWPRASAPRSTSWSRSSRRSIPTASSIPASSACPPPSARCPGREHPRRRRRHLGGAGRGGPPRRHRGAHPPRPGAARHAVPRPGRVRRLGHRHRGPRGGRPQPGRRWAGRRRRDRQPAGLHPGVGPGHRHAGRTRAGLAGPADGRHLPRAPGPGHPHRPQRVGHQAVRHPGRRRPRPVPVRSGANWPSAPSTPGWRGSCRTASCTSPTPPTPG